MKTKTESARTAQFIVGANAQRTAARSGPGEYRAGEYGRRRSTPLGDPGRLEAERGKETSSRQRRLRVCAQGCRFDPGIGVGLGEGGVTYI